MLTNRFDMTLDVVKVLGNDTNTHTNKQFYPTAYGSSQASSRHVDRLSGADPGLTKGGGAQVRANPELLPPWIRACLYIIGLGI